MARKSVLLANLAIRQCCRQLSSNSKLSNMEIISKRNSLFGIEKTRQAALVTRVEKIEVKYDGNPEPCTMIMNKNISTPFDCTKHLPEPIRNRTVLAFVNGKPWDMHAPLTEDCTLTLAHFKDKIESNVKLVNKTFWRSCSFMLGYAVERSFKDEHTVTLHSWPAPAIHSGSFVYDVELSMANWNPSPIDCRIIGSAVRRVAINPIPFERLVVDASVAKKIFEDNKFKSEQVDEVAGSSDNSSVVLYRCADHVDMSCGPMISNLSHVGDFTVVSIHPFETPVGLMHRFQGISIPTAFTMSPFAKNVLVDRAREMNTTGLPEEAIQFHRDAQVKIPNEAEEETAKDEVDHHEVRHEDDDHHHTTKERHAAQ